MPHKKPDLRQEVDEMDDEKCDKGPILNRIVDHVERLDKHAAKSERFQESMSEAVVLIARQQEKIVAIADKTQRNQDDIQNLFKLTRTVETHLNDHILSSGHSAQGKQDKDTKFDRVQVAVITAAILGALGFAKQFIQTVMSFMTTHSGG